MLKVLRSSWYLMFLFKSLCAFFDAPPLGEAKPITTITTTSTTTSTTGPGRVQLVAAAKHFSSVHRIRLGS
ncbi:hypothetical protein BVRB_2g028250 [Beta vulgaris subsp. vulgaris]|nr:hypothetical protein BVRB_2g028250 [Beta vulgaris subsp. vulgaris]